MDQIVDKASLDILLKQSNRKMDRPSREEAEAAVKTLLLWSGDDPDREGLLDTPARVAKAPSHMSSAINQPPALYAGLDTGACDGRSSPTSRRVPFP